MMRWEAPSVVPIIAATRARSRRRSPTTPSAMANVAKMGGGSDSRHGTERYGNEISWSAIGSRGTTICSAMPARRSRTPNASEATPTGFPRRPGVGAVMR
jgi:hypothetical protein